MIKLVLAVVAGLLVLPDFARAEDRIVTKTTDSDDGVCNADCSLREAVGVAVTGDRVVLGPLTYNLTLGELVLDDFYDIDGAGARATTIQSSGFDRVAFVDTGAPTFTDLTITGGVADDGSEPQNAGGAFAVDADAELRLLGVTLTGNHAVVNGGAIANFGDLSVTESTISGNSAGSDVPPIVAGQGGGIYIGANSGAVQLLNSTISGNEAVLDLEGFSRGGGIYAQDSFSTDFVTIANNSATVGSGLYTAAGSAGVHYTLIADNTFGEQCDGALDELEESFNLEEGSSCEFSGSSDIQVGNAFLAPLEDNGGQTETHGLLAGSRAINGVTTPACDGTTDQRLLPRSAAPCDIGAFETVEFRPEDPDDEGDNTCLDVPSECTLRDAVAQASAYDTIFPHAGVWELDGSLTLTGDNIVGASPRNTTIQTTADGERVMQAISGSNRVSRVTITGGEAPLDQGGGLLVLGANTSLELSDSRVTNNFAQEGGGVANVGATLDVIRSTITDNESNDDTEESWGGGIFSDVATAETTITDSTISGNQARSGENSGLGGGIAVFGGSLIGRNVTLAGNTAWHQDDPIGGIGSVMWVEPTAPPQPDVTISNTIIAVGITGPGACAGAAFSRDHNVVNDSSCGSPVRNPLLGPLQDNGGVTDTHAIPANSPAVDAGANCSSTDQRGQLRRRACDAGAYEFQGTPTPPSGGQQPPPPPTDDDELPPPKAGKNVNALPKSGTVRIKLPGSDTFVELVEGQQIPVGTIVDARKGRVTLIAAGGGEADFYGGIFKIGQTKGAKPLTTLSLTEKLTCPKKNASAAAKKKRKRRLWGDGNGRFRTKGKHSAATVVGTKWLVEDKCKSTLTRVVRGKVRVRDFVKKKNVTVKAGKKYVARARR